MTASQSNSANSQSGEAPFWTAAYPKGVAAKIEDQIAKYNSILDVFDESVKRFPTRPAFSNLGKTLTYSELGRKAECFAAYLQNELKMQKGERIALQMPNCLQYPIALFGALKAGLVIVNTNPLYTDREMTHQFNDSGATAVVILSNFAHLIQGVQPKTKIRHVIVSDLGDALSFPKRQIVNFVVARVRKMVPAYNLPDSILFTDAMERGASMTFTPVKMEISDIAFLQYTGGTTGVAKGAMLTHRNVVSNMEMVHTWVSPRLVEAQEVAICALPLYHIFAMTLHALALVRYGAHNILITNPRDLKAVIKDMGSYKFTMISGVNTLFNAFNHSVAFAKLDFSSLKLSIAGGMALQQAVASRWLEMTKTKVIEGYGLTETSPVACCNPVDDTDRVGSIGLPFPSTIVKMIDEDGNDVELGQAGELCVKGPQVMKGYWQQPEETAKVMTADGFFKTGDIGVMDKDGFCKIVDRKKDMILVSGFNVYPNEIEDVLAKMPGVLESAAVGIPSPHSGEVVKVFIVKKDPALTAEAVIAYCRKEMTSYKVPKQVEFRTELPKTNVGKILRRALR